MTPSTSYNTNAYLSLQMFITLHKLTFEIPSMFKHLILKHDILGHQCACYWLATEVARSSAGTRLTVK